MKKQYQLYEECPYFDMRSPHNDFNHNRCGCNPCRPNHPDFCPPLQPDFPVRPPMCNPPSNNNCKCSNNELLYLLSGILIGKSLD